MLIKTEDAISIRTMTVEDYKRVKIFLRDHFFTTEPLTSTSEEDESLCEEQDTDEYHLALIRQGTSLVAVDSTDQILGLVLAGGQVPSDLEKNRRAVEKMQSHIKCRIDTFLSKVERDANIYERYGLVKALYLHIINVAPSARGRGLGAQLTTSLMAMGRDRGFPLMLAYCTSYYSARQLEALGMECAYAKSYAEYKDEQDNVIFKPPAPHTHLKVMAIRL
ncbi:uncharacterized protein LOC115626443 [Scaptodrosophila lebanonensis]|uniref:aralkylamine N-acetyltransferase n=1 Tax=Drosophila lebanonensis TaxID=7225 RepID=A0A6J2TM86_DROLE|nr:uncharacterized protein LOC115626443 [Scaptodrosophila lebanonensis]